MNEMATRVAATVARLEENQGREEFSLPGASESLSGRIPQCVRVTLSGKNLPPDQHEQNPTKELSSSS